MLRFITTAGQFDQSALMRRANALAARSRSEGWNARISIKVALKMAWAEARGEMAIHQARHRVGVVVMRQVALDTYLPV